MPAAFIDTLKLSKALTAADFTPTQAEGLIATLSETSEKIATKADIEKLGDHIDNLGISIRAEMKEDRAKSQAEFATTRADFAHQMSLMRADSVRWIVTAIAFNFLATFGLFMGFRKFFGK